MSVDLELRHLKHFVAVAEELHFTRASQRLNISQPPLSQSIQQLEARIGVSLFRRSSRRVELTPAGSTLLIFCQRWLAELQTTIETVRRVARGELGTLRLGFTDSAALSVLPELVRSIRQRFPQVHLELIEDATFPQVQALRKDLIDVALVRGPLVDAGLQIQVLRREGFLVAIPQEHELARRSRVTLPSIEKHPIVLFPRRLAPEFYDQIIEMSRARGLTLKISYEGSDYQTILSLVAAGLGLSLVPACVQNLQRTGVVFRRIVGVKETTQVIAAYKKDRPLAVLTSVLGTWRC